jgi:Zn-dependent peptidase ImmA (M78 family)/transcriptional regulator with XRE-family HTH domain
MVGPTENQSALILPSQLLKARRALLLTLEEVAHELSVGVLEVSRWEAGGSEPSLEQLEALARLYGREMDYFLAETPEPPQNIKFRATPGQAFRHLSRGARVVLAKFEELCRCASELEGLLGKTTTCRLPRFAPSTPSGTAANAIRQSLGVATGPMRDLRELLERQGVRIFQLAVPSNEFSGFSFRHAVYGACILLNASEVAGRRNFTLAHELAHLVYGHEPSVCLVPLSPAEPSPPLERVANSFTVELLLPAPRVREDFLARGYSSEPSEEDLARMSGKWGISMQALGYRLESLGLVQRGHTEKLVEQKPRFRAARAPKWERRLGKAFAQACFEAYERQLISIGKLAHSLDIPIRKAAEEVERRGK